MSEKRQIFQRVKKRRNVERPWQLDSWNDGYDLLVIDENFQVNRGQIAPSQQNFYFRVVNLSIYDQFFKFFAFFQKWSKKKIIIFKKKKKKRFFNLLPNNKKNKPKQTNKISNNIQNSENGFRAFQTQILPKLIKAHRTRESAFRA